MSAFSGQKPQFGANFDILRAPIPTPFYRSILVCYSTPAVYACLPNFDSISLFCRPLLAKNPNFAVFGLWHLVVSPIGSSLRKLDTGAQLQTFPYPKVSKLFLYSNAGAQSLTFKSVTDKQTNTQADRQKNQRFWPPRRRVKSEPHQTWHG